MCRENGLISAWFFTLQNCKKLIARFLKKYATISSVGKDDFLLLGDD